MTISLLILLATLLSWRVHFKLKFSTLLVDEKVVYYSYVDSRRKKMAIFVRDEPYSSGEATINSFASGLGLG